MMDYVIAAIFTLVIGGLLVRTTKKEFKIIGSIALVLDLLFIAITQVVKFQTGHFFNPSSETFEAVGGWVLSFFMLLSLYILFVMNYRWIKAALTKKGWVKGFLIALDVLVSIILILVGSFLLFILGVLYFGFAP
ncbi:hypothetical protein [Paraliobacillus ryukyuensis]|nr:hypothetical protein [Paraliobacillus ryukyuensis]